MPRIADNADVWAESRQGIYFPATSYPASSADGDLTGQCVSLLKWFFAQMTDVPNPFAARGDARNVGKTLVAQGLAVEVPYAQRRRGDVITTEYGTYGHIYLQLSGGRVFEENANAGGAAKRVLSNGTVVYASRIGSETESFRRDVHVYRINSYSEKGDDMIEDTQRHYDIINREWNNSTGRDLTRNEFRISFVGRDKLEALVTIHGSIETVKWQSLARLGKQAQDDNWQKQIYDLQAHAKILQEQIANLQKQIESNGDNAALKKQLEERQAQLDSANQQIAILTKSEADLKAQLASAGGDTDLLNSFGKVLAQLIARLGLKK